MSTEDEFHPTYGDMGIPYTVEQIEEALKDGDSIDATEVEFLVWKIRSLERELAAVSQGQSEAV